MILTEFVEYRGKSIRVSELKKYSNIKIEVQCPECGDIRITTLSNINRNGHHYCRKCYLKIKNTIIMNVGEKYGKWNIISNGNKVGYSLCKCECGTIREVDNYTLRSGKSKSCGCIMTEFNKNNRKHLKVGEKYYRLTIVNHSEKSGFSICKCECGSVCTIANNRLASGKTKSCGCLQKEQASIALTNVMKDLKGENHPNWKGGITPTNHRIRGSSEYSDWRVNVFQRDDYTCQCCGQIGYELNAHHIKNYADNEDCRTMVDNGITLCTGCHRLFHSDYGRQNNTEFQLNEFLEKYKKKVG